MQYVLLTTVLLLAATPNAQSTDGADLVIRSSLSPVRVHTAADIAALPRDTRSVVATGVSDADVGKLAARCPNLEHLSFGGWHARPAPRITDIALEHVATLPRLRSLDLTFAAAITTVGLTSIQELPRLRRLGLGAISMRSIELSPLQRMRALRDIDLGVNMGFRTRHLTALLKVPALQKLRLAGSARIATTELLRLVELKELRELDLNDVNGARPARGGVPRSAPGFGVTGEVIEALACLRKLRVIRVAGCDVSSTGLQALAATAALVHLDVSRTQVEDESLRAVLAACELRSLQLNACTRLTRGIMPTLLAEATLERLSLTGVAWVTEVDRKALGALPAMRELAATSQKPRRR